MRSDERQPPPGISDFRYRPTLTRLRWEGRDIERIKRDDETCYRIVKAT